MKIRSFLRYLDIRWFRGLKVRPTRPLRRRTPSLLVEALERRDMLSVTRPTILAVTPLDGSTVTSATPALTVTYSEPMSGSATVAGNYLLFGSAGNAVTIDSVTLSAPDTTTGHLGNETATISYNEGNGLTLDTYTLFVQGSQITSDAAHGSTAMALPGEVAVANSGRSNVSIINVPGSSDLSAISQYALPTGATTATLAGPVAVAIGNLTGTTLANGQPENDLVILNKTSEQILIYQGLVDGGYSSALSYTINLSATETGTSALVLGNFSGSSLPDIVVANSTTNNITFFRNESTAGSAPSFTGTVAFGAGTDSAAGTNPTSLAAGDFNADGALDLAVGDTSVDAGSNYDVTLFPGLGNANFFGTPVTIAVGSSTATAGLGNVIPTALTTGYFDGASSIDLAAAGSAGLAVLLNNTQVKTNLFSFKEQGVSTVSFTNVVAGVVRGTASITATTQADLVAATTSGNLVMIFQNSGSASIGSASFMAPVSETVGTSPQGLALAALLNGNSQEDILVTQNIGDTTAGASGQLTVLLNSSTLGSVSFTQAVGSPYGVDGNPVALAVGTDDGDGLTDVVTVNNSTNDFTVLEGAGDGTFLTGTNIGLGKTLAAVAVGDLNGDGIPDLVFAENGAGNGNSSITVMLGQVSGNSIIYPAAGTFTYTSLGVKTVVSLAIGDITANGLPDIVVLDQGDDSVGVLVNNISSSTVTTLGAGSFTAGPLIALKTGSGFFTTTFPSPTQLVLAPFTTNSKNNNLDDIAVAYLGTAGGGHHFGGSTPGGVVLLSNTTTLAAGSTTYSFSSPNDVTSTEITNNITGGFLAVGDFNADGKLDFVLSYNNNSGTPYADVYLGDGTGKFSEQNGKPNTLNVASAGPVAVGDFNADGLPDIVVASQSTSLTLGGIDVLFNSFGTGFDAPVRTSVLPGTALQSIVVANLNASVFPDLIVTTASGGGTLDNVYTLLNNGGSFLNVVPLPYLAGGTSSPTLASSSAVDLSNSLIRVTTFTSGGTTVRTNLVVNGNFAAAGLTGTPGSLLGWQTYDLDVSPGGSYGAWSDQSGTNSPLSFTGGLTAPAGGFQAMLDEENLQPNQNGYTSADSATYDGTHALYQDIFIPGDATKVTLTLTLMLDNLASTWSDNTGSGPQVLDYRNASPDQQVRVDIMNTTAADSFGYTGSTGVLDNLFLSTTSTSFSGGTPGTLTLTDDLSAFAGQTIELRIAETNNQGLLLVGVDNVNVTAQFNDTFTPTIGNLGLRNPGFTDSTTGAADHTTDATLIGTVADAGSLNNISYLEIDTGGTNFTGTNLYKINTFDPLGNFSFQIPNPLPGLQTIDLLVVDKGGNSTSTTFTYFYQGPSLTDWQAYGPDNIAVPAGSMDGSESIAYTSVAGSITAIATDPTDPSGNTFFVGSLNGGVWKTTDGGNDYTPLTDNVKDSNGNPVPVPVGGLAVSKTVASATNTHIVYVGTGVGNADLDAQSGFGVLVSTQVNGNDSFAVDGNSGTVLAGAKITSVVIDNDNPNIVYVAVASGGEFGAGVYKTTNALGNSSTTVNTSQALWTYLTSDSVMFTAGNSATTLAAGTALASATDLIEDPFNSNRLILGLGNIGLVTDNATAGVWLSANGGQSWILQSGGDNGITKSTLPSGTTVGRVTVAMGTGREGDENTVYVLFGAALSSLPSAPNFGYSGDLDGPNGSPLYKSSNNMLDFTNVMLKVNTPAAVQGYHNFKNLTLLGNNASNTGALLVDPSDPNVVYVGGSTEWLNNIGSTDVPFLRIDTGNMDGITGSNNGDDLNKEATAAGKSDFYSVNSSGTPVDPYVGEGVYWYDLEAGAINDNATSQELVPPNIQALTFNAQGQLLIGTDSGIWSADLEGFGYDFTSGGQGIIRTGKGQKGFSAPGATVTNLNGNLEIADVTSVAIDPTQSGVLYTTQYNTGSALSSNVLNWTSNALSGPTINGTNLGITTAGNVLVSLPPPNSPTNTETTLYRVWEYANTQAVDPEQSTDSGVDWSGINSTGIPISNNPAGTFPAFVVNPTPFLNSGLFENELLFGTNRVFISNTSGTVWDQFSPVLSSSASGLITALAYAPSSDSVFFAGDAIGEVFVTTNQGGAWKNVSTGLPAVQVNAIVVDPNNSSTAYALFGVSTGGTVGHIFKTINDGSSSPTWSNVTNNLPSSVTSANAMVIVPGANGSETIYLGTNVGVFESTNGGSSWSNKFATGLPNVPVVDLQYNSKLGVLAVATLGRGVFTLSTDTNGPTVTAITNGSLASDTTTITSIDVSFDKPTDPRTFTAAEVTVTGPGGTSIALSGAPVSLDAVNNETYQVNFATAQSANGFYTISVGPAVKDLVGNVLYQNLTGLDGEETVSPSGDIFQGRLDFQGQANVAPVLTSTAVTFTPAINEDGLNVPGAASSNGIDIASWLASDSPALITDSNTGAVQGLAITSVDDSHGTWEYSQNSGTTWTNIPSGSASNAVTDANALLLQASSNNRLRFVPNTAYYETITPVSNSVGNASFTFKAWDLTSGLDPLTGTDGGYADTTLSGATAFSSQEATASLQILFDNHTPTFTVAGSQNGNQSVLESASPSPTLTTVNNWATGLSAGPTNESSQVLNFVVTNSDTALFTTTGQPTITVSGSASAGFTGTLTYQQQQYAFGVDSVTVVLHDNGGKANGGNDTSSSITFTINIAFVNQPPTFSVNTANASTTSSETITSSGNITILESAVPAPSADTVTSWATSISAGPGNPSSETVSFNVGSTNASLFSTPPAISPNGTLTFTPAQYANGTALVTVSLKNSGGGNNTSASDTFTITILPVNQPPTFSVNPANAQTTSSETITANGSITTLESAAPSPQPVTVAGWATSISPGPANQSSESVSFTVTNDTNPGLFSVAPTISPTGTLSYTPAQFANGSASITVVVVNSGGTANGGQNTSVTDTFIITILPVNQPPTFTGDGDQTITADNGPNLLPQQVANWATNLSAGPANQSSETLSFVVTNNNNALFAVQPTIDATGKLSYTLAANANGSATVTAILQSSGSTANGGSNQSAPYTFHINVLPVDQAPSFTGGGNQTATTYGAQQTVANWATNLSVGPAYEAWQSRTFQVSNNNNALFAVQPTIDANGTLTYTPGSTIGTATVTVLLQDSGNTANGGQNTTAAYTFTITVTPVIAAGTADQAWISQVYRNVLGREINGGLPNEVFYWTNQLSGGASRLEVAQQVASSAEYYTNYVQSLFITYLGAAPSTAQLEYYLNLYNQGETDQQIQTTILSSDTYYQVHGNTNAGFVAGLYENVQGYTPATLDPTGMAYWEGQLSAGMSRASVAAAFVNSPTTVARTVEAGYLLMLNRVADAGGLAYWQGQIEAGMTNENFLANLAATPEYGLDSTTKYYNSQPDVNWLNQVYLDALNRPVDSSGQTYFINQIRIGDSRAFVVAEILNSGEYHNDEAAAAFQAILRRPADANGIAYFANYLNAGFSLEQVEALIYASPEYFAAQGGGTDQGFLTALYRDALGATLDQNGMNYWLPQLTQGVVSPSIIADPNTDPLRESVALGVLTSGTGFQGLVAATYQDDLRHLVSTGASAYWVGLLTQGLSPAQFYTGIFASQEFYNDFSH